MLVCIYHYVDGKNIYNVAATTITAGNLFSYVTLFVFIDKEICMTINHANVSLLLKFTVDIPLSIKLAE